MTSPTPSAFVDRDGNDTLVCLPVMYGTQTTLDGVYGVFVFFRWRSTSARLRWPSRSCHRSRLSGANSTGRQMALGVEARLVFSKSALYSSASARTALA